MTPEQVKLVKESFAKVVPIAEDAAAMFYGKLFELNPDYKALFKGDMKEQGKKLMKMIGTAVNSLDRLEEVVPAVQDMGRRHVGYGVKKEDYGVVGEALIWTLGEGLGEAFTDETKDAWVEVYTILATTMIEAAEEQAA
jgi:hemoglobin-like flavoprotein